MSVGAMVLGLIVGVGEVFGGAANVIESTSHGWGVVEWLAIALIPLGIIAIVGGIYALLRPDLAAAILLFACVTNLGVGLYAASEVGSYFVSPLWKAYSLLTPTVLLAIASGLALAKRQKG